jgi:hypothetical protein
VLLFAAFCCCPKSCHDQFLTMHASHNLRYDNCCTTCGSVSKTPDGPGAYSWTTWCQVALSNAMQPMLKFQTRNMITGFHTGSEAGFSLRLRPYTSSTQQLICCACGPHSASISTNTGSRMESNTLCNRGLQRQPPYNNSPTCVQMASGRYPLLLALPRIHYTKDAT